MSLLRLSALRAISRTPASWRSYATPALTNEASDPSPSHKPSRPQSDTVRPHHLLLSFSQCELTSSCDLYSQADEQPSGYDSLPGSDNTASFENADGSKQNIKESGKSSESKET